MEIYRDLEWEYSLRLMWAEVDEILAGAGA